MPPKSHYNRPFDPEVEEVTLEELLCSLGEEYGLTFSRDQQLRHLREMNLLSPEVPVRAILDVSREKRGSCTVIAFDYPWEFSLITGLLSGMGFEILSGDVFTYRPDECAQKRIGIRKVNLRKRIIDHFTGIVTHPLSPSEWEIEFSLRLKEIISLLEIGTKDSLDKARSLVNEMVVGRISEFARQGASAFYPVSINVDNDSRPCTAITVISQDTPAFLYSLSTALSINGILIERVRIRTVEGAVEDRFELLGLKGDKITDQDQLDRLILSVLLTKQFTYSLVNAPDPYAALFRFARMIEDLLASPGRGAWIELLREPGRLNDLARILGASDYLWEDFIRLQYEALFPVLSRHMEERSTPSPPEKLRELADGILAKEEGLEEKALALNEMKDRELFLIDLDQILHPDWRFENLSRRLTSLAEVIVQTALRTALEHHALRFGKPRSAAGLETSMAVFGLGKLGGRALGYASDIELLFVYGDSGETDGEEAIENAEFFEKVVKTVISVIRTKREGIFKVDIRLRPYGDAGPLAVSLESYCRYFGPGGDAHAYERLAQVRLRAIAGDGELGARVERIRDELTYQGERIRWDEICELREKQYLSKALNDQPNAKFCAGGLVDLEYGIQALQAEFGRQYPAVRTPILEDALEAMGREGILYPDEAETLSSSYTFLRALINGMRMLRGSAKDLHLPGNDNPESDHLARRIGYRQRAGLSPREQLRIDFEAHTAAVRAFIERRFGKESVPEPRGITIADMALSDELPLEACSEVLRASGFVNPQRACANIRGLAGKGGRRMVFAKLLVLAADILRRSPDPDMALNNWERFTRVLPSPEFHYGLMLSQPMRLEILLGLFSFSQFLADTLVRNPTFLDWVVLPEITRSARKADELSRELLSSLLMWETERERLNELRRLRRRELLRIGVRDLCLRAPLQEVTEELSTVADAFMDAALRICLDEQRGSAGHGAGFLQADELREHFCILALGKLGGRELNYSSDIDILGFWDDRALKGLRGPRTFSRTLDEAKDFFLRLMGKVRNALSAHTEEGYVYRVDLRLRPFGGAGELVPAFSSLLDYYTKSASIWELQSLIKARSVTGNKQLGNDLLSEIWARTISGKDLSGAGRAVDAMRRKGAEFRRNKLGHGRDIKNEAGGLRDVEFLVQGLQLICARSLPFPFEGNTLNALRLLAEHFMLPEEEAAQLREDYIFLRRIEHCLQIMDDRQVHCLPTSREELLPLSKRMLGTEADPLQFLDRVDKCLERIRKVYSRRLLMED